MNKGRFITIEGIEGAGKSTAMQGIAGWLQARQVPCRLTREPGGTPVAEAIRHLVLSPDMNESIQPETELLLFFAGRAQHIARVIVPALTAGEWVVSDRYVDASYAYQCGGRGLSPERFVWLEQWIAGSIQPELTFLLDLPPETGLQRARARGPQDRIEQETLAFFQRVREAYLERAKQFPERICVVDAMQSEARVRQQLLDRLEAFFQTVG